MPEESRAHQVHPVRTVVGLLVVTLGVLFLAENLGYAEARVWLEVFWPAALATIGLAILLRPRPEGRAWGFVWLAAAGVVLANQRGWLDVDFWDLFFPLALVLVGGRIVWRAVAGQGRGRRRHRFEAGEDTVRSFALLSGNEVRVTSPNFRGGEIGAVMGGAKVDLTQAGLAEGGAELDVLAMWGGIEIVVPESWSVESRVVPLLGAYEDKSRPRSVEGDRRLVVTGTVVMGGVEVKN